jgi:uncharacterized protein
VKACSWKLQFSHKASWQRGLVRGHLGAETPPGRAMKFEPDQITNANVISAYTSDTVTVNGEVWHASLVLPSQGRVTPWAPHRVAELGASDFEALLVHDPELVIFGSGARLSFPPPECLRALIERRVGFETMDTAAACRTYNVLVSEGRRVVAGLLLGIR